MKSEGEITGAMERLGVSRSEAETVEYVGDGVYIWNDMGMGQFWLGTLEGNKIALGPRELQPVLDCVKNWGYKYD